MKNFIILGGTGSIGSQVLDLIKENQEQLLGFSFNNNIAKALEIIDTFKPKYVACMNKEDSLVIKNKYPNIIVFLSKEGLVDLVKVKEENLYIVNALVGSIGLLPSYEVVSRGLDLYLANKETLVIGGSLINQKCGETGSKIIPIDSEHSAIYQLLKGQNNKEISKLYITASGGAFRDYSIEDLKDVSVNDALKHPNWSMGKKITIDCATMMNKCFELIEAHYLFNIDIDKIIPLLHKESIVHSMVEFNDYSIFAQMSNPDMHLPIEYAIFENHEKHISNLSPLDFSNLNLSFTPLNEERFKLITLSRLVLKKGGYYPTILNAVNEVAVEMFLNNKIKFIDIEKMIFDEINNASIYYQDYINDILSIDKIIELDQKIKNKYKQI